MRKPSYLKLLVTFELCIVAVGIYMMFNLVKVEASKTVTPYITGESIPVGIDMSEYNAGLGNILNTSITVEELQNADGDQEGIVNYGRNIEGVEVSIFVREKGDKYKVSLRANEYVDVSQISAKFAGGGHLRAAGFEMAMSLEQTKQTVVEEIKKQLK